MVCILEKKRAFIQVSLSNAMYRIKVFVLPLLEENEIPYIKWNPENGRWE